MPLNFSKAHKWILISQFAAITFLSPLATTIVAPAASYIDADLHNSSSILSSFVTSVYLLGMSSRAESLIFIYQIHFHLRFN